MSFLTRVFKPATVSRAASLAARFYASEASASGKLIVNFALPHQTVLKNKEVNQVDLAAVSGDLGILADHVPTIEQLKPGIIDFISESGSEKYFVSGGFAIMNPNSTLNINAIEAFKLEDIDSQSVASNLAESQRLVANAKDEVSKAAAEIEVELYEALQTALSTKA